MKASIWVLLPSVAMGALGMTLLLPILPSLKASWFLCSDCEKDLKKAQEISGIFSSLRYFVIFLASPYLGRLSDKIGRIPLIRLSNLGAFLLVLALFLTNGESGLAYYTMFVLTGFVSSGSFCISAYVADCSAPHDRARYFGLLGAVYGLSLLLSPIMTLATKSMSYSGIFIMCGTLLFINGIYIECILPESLELPSTEEATTTTSETTTEEDMDYKSCSSAGFNLLRKNRTLAWLAVFIFLTTLPEQGVSEVVLIYLDDVLKIDKDEMRKFSSLYLSLTGIGLLVSQTLYIWIFTKLKVGPVGLMIISNIANSAHMVMYASLSYNHSFAVAYTNVFITSFMFVGLPAGNAYISKQTHSTEQGLAMGTLDSVRSLVGAFGPVFFSFLYSYFGNRYDFPQAPFIFGAVFASLALFVICGPLSKEQEEISEAATVTEPLLFVVEPV